MIRQLCTSLLLIGCSLSRAAMPLADAAAQVSQELPHGCIVTAEWRDGIVKYGINGPDKPDGVAAEKVVFEIGSVSKVFTGLLFAQAVLEGKLKLETTLREALAPEQKFADEKVAQITLVQLATHTSGLPRLPFDPMFVLSDPYANYDAKHLSLWLETGVKIEPGPHAHAYSNVGVALLGHAVERALGDSWENLVLKRICEPLGMKDTGMTLSEAQRTRLAPPFRGGEPGAEWRWKVFAPAGGLRSTAEDIITFGRALAEPDKSPLRAVIEFATTPRAKAPGGQVGCCFVLGGTPAALTVWHNGKTGGYQSFVGAMPSLKRVRVVLMNNTVSSPEAVLKAALK